MHSSGVNHHNTTVDGPYLLFYLFADDLSNTQVIDIATSLNVGLRSKRLSSLALLLKCERQNYLLYAYKISYNFSV
jgi:hypothetical protein